MGQTRIDRALLVERRDIHRRAEPWRGTPAGAPLSHPASPARAGESGRPPASPGLERLALAWRIEGRNDESRLGYPGRPLRTAPYDGDDTS